MSDYIEVEGKTYVNAAYLTLANQTAKQARARASTAEVEIARLRAALNDIRSSNESDRWALIEMARAALEDK